MLMGITPCLWDHIYKKDTHSAIFKIQSWKTFLCLPLWGLALKWVIGKAMDQMGPSHQYSSKLSVQPAFPSRFYPLFSLTFHQVCGTAQSLFSVNYLCLEQIIAVRSQKQNTNGCVFVIHLILPFLLFGTNFDFYLHFTFLQQYQNKRNKSFTVCFGKINSH